MKADWLWSLKAFALIFLLASVGLMIYRTWYWLDHCVLNKIHVYPPVYRCGVHPFDFNDNYIDMSRHNEEMSERVRASAPEDDFPPSKGD